MPMPTNARPAALLLGALLILPAVARVEDPEPAAKDLGEQIVISVPEAELEACRKTLAQVTGAPVDQPAAISPAPDTLPAARCVAE